MRSSTKTVVCLGLIGGTLFSFNPAAQAQVQIIGGDFSGPAGFFMPTNTDNAIKLLDVVPKELNIESSIGNTSTAVFQPTAASFTDVNADDLVNTDDTGIIQGLLTGLAYDADARPVLFVNVPTQLDFAVDTFEIATTVPALPNDGTLISPKVVGSAPLVFINKPVTLTGGSAANFDATPGNLDVGELNALLEGGTIALSETYSFAESSGGDSTPLPAFDRRIRFAFAGTDVEPEDDTELDISDDEIRFVGEANQTFQIQTLGTTATAEFQIQAPSGAVDITLGGPFTVIQGDPDSIDVEQALDFDIKGQAEGSFTTFLSNDQAVAQFDGTAVTQGVQLRFQQGGDRFDGRSDGTVNFIAAAGVSSVSEIDFTTFEPSDDPAACTASCSDETPELSPTDVRFVTIEDLLDEADDETDTEVEDPAEDMSEDEVEAVENELEDDEEFADVDDIEINVFLVGLDRYYVVSPGKSYAQGKRNAFGRDKVRCFKQRGPGSSIFPGLISLVPVDIDEIPTQIIVGLSEIPEATTDDAGTDDETQIIEGLPEATTDDDTTDDAGTDTDDETQIIEGLPEATTDDSATDDAGTDDETLVIEGLPEATTGDTTTSDTAAGNATETQVTEGLPEATN